MDKLTKYAHFIATTTEVTAEESAILLFKRVIKFFGMPSKLIGDRDPRWTSDVWKSLALLFGTRLALSTSKHPQTDGQTEVMNQHLETMLRAYVKRDLTDWAEWLDVLQFAYNNATHSAHKSKPAELLLGYKPRSPLDFLKEHGLTVLDGQHSLRSRLMDLAAHREAARDAIQRSADRQAFQHDKGRKAPQLDLGDEVLINPHALELIETKGKGRKLIQRKIGPFEITEVVSPTAFRLRLPDSYPMHNVVNIRHLTKYHRSLDKQRPTLTNPRDLLKSSEEYEVEKIVGEKRSKGKSFYKVRWKGYDAENDSWQSARDLRNAPELLKEWKAQLWRLKQRTLRSRVTILVFDVYYLAILRIHDIYVTKRSPITNDMSRSSHSDYRARVTVDPTASSPAPVDEGKKKGYFDDTATRVLLDLDPKDTLLHSGTYGDKELSVKPIKLTTLRSQDFDRRILPFTPANHAFTSTYIAMHERNGQYPVLAQTRRVLEEALNKALLDAQIAANEAGISLPNYAMVLVPRFKYSEGGDDRPFPHQFKIFFDPSASRTRGVRIGRVGAILDATTNRANTMAKDSQDWPKGDPIGIQLDVDELTEEDCRILAAYSTFKLPVIGQLPAGVKLPSFLREEARDVLIGKVLGKLVPNTLIPDTSPGFDPDSGVDDDALLYLIIAPDHDEHNLNADGEAKTRGQHRDGPPPLFPSAHSRPR